MNFEDLSVDDFDDLFGVTETKSTLLNGGVDIVLSMPDEKMMLAAARDSMADVKVAQDTDDDTLMLLVSLDVFYRYGNVFIAGDNTMSQKHFYGAMQNSTPEEKGVVYDFVTASIASYLDPMHRADDEPEKKS